MKRSSSVSWNGGLEDGHGVIATDGHPVKLQYSYGTRFDGEPGTNPEELIAAAHAGCFSMALARLLGEAGLDPQSIQTTATVTLANDGHAPAISEVHLDVSARLVGAADAERFAEVALRAKEGSAVSRLLNADITMDARLAA